MHRRSIIVCIVYHYVRKENYVIILPYVSSLELCSVQTRDKGGDVKKLAIIAPWSSNGLQLMVHAVGSRN